MRNYMHKTAKNEKMHKNELSKSTILRPIIHKLFILWLSHGASALAQSKRCYERGLGDLNWSCGITKIYITIVTVFVVNWYPAQHYTISFTSLTKQEPKAYSSLLWFVSRITVLSQQEQTRYIKCYSPIKSILNILIQSYTLNPIQVHNSL